MILKTLKFGLDKMVFEQMTPALAITSTGQFVIYDQEGIEDKVMLIGSNALAYLYSHENDGWITLPSPALAGTFGAGACGCFKNTGPNGTATAGSTTTITTNLTIPRGLNGYVVRITGGTNAGQERVILSNTTGTNAVITVKDAFPAPIDNTSTYVLMTGRYYVLGAGTLAAGSFKYWDRALSAWSGNLSITNFAASWGTEGRMVATGACQTSRDSHFDGSIVSSTSTVMTVNAKFTTNEHINRTIRIIEGTGVGQVRYITANTEDTITVNAAFSVTPTSSSKFMITGIFGGKATSGGATTITNAAKTWTNDQWINFQVRIAAGTGVGQVRTITDNDATSLTVAAWTTQPDNTSYYVIEGNDDYIYVSGNNATAFYRYSISANTWSTMTVAPATRGIGHSLDWIVNISDSSWNNESNNLVGRYIYSFRGTATSTLSRYDITTNSWENLTYGNQAETFTTGSCACADRNEIYISKENTGRVFRYIIPQNRIESFGTFPYPNSTAVAGNKMWTYNYTEKDDYVKFVYYLSHSLTNLHRCQVIE